MAEIELVIKIDEEQYEFIKQSMIADVIKNYHALLYDICERIANGTTLRKGHGGLVDVDDLREDFKASKKISFAERMDISCIVDHAEVIIKADTESEG